MNTYKCFTKNGIIEVEARTSYEAQVKANDKLAVRPKYHGYTEVVLVAKGDVVVPLSPSSLPGS